MRPRSIEEPSSALPATSRRSAVTTPALQDERDDRHREIGPDWAEERRPLETEFSSASDARAATSVRFKLIDSL